jgi:hypothetical protein
MNFTNSARQKIRQFNLTENMIHDAIQFPDRTSPGRDKGTTLFQKSMSVGWVTVVAKQDRGEWLILSCWAKGAKSNYKKPYDSRYKNASFWKRVWLDILTTFGL